jgi:serine/threonine protein phosphatase 1
MTEMPARTVAIGDIHGCSRALEALLAAIRPTPEDLLVVLGDYVDRGPDSRAVIDRLRALDRECRLRVLTGNHEQMMLRGVEEQVERRFWLCYGGQATLDSYGGRLESIPNDHLDFLRSGLRFYETETHIFVHANYQADLTLAQQPEAVLVWTHLDRHLPTPHASGKTAVVGHTPQLSGEVLDLGHEAVLVWTHLDRHLPTPHASGKTAVVGHTPQLSGEVLDLGHLICIDTYCCGGGWLTALEVHSRTLWQANLDGQLRNQGE